MMQTRNIFKKKSVRVILIIITLLVLIRLILPFVVLRYANKTLANMKGYYGQIKDIDLAILRGAYQIDSIYLNKVDTLTQKQTVFFSALFIDLSIEWKAILKGVIVGEVVMNDALVRFTKDELEPDDIKNDSSQFIKLLNDFMPLKVNKFEINNADLQFIDTTSKPNVDIRMTDLYVLALNLNNSYDSTTLLPASVTANANLYEGEFKFNMKFNPLVVQPTFDMSAELNGMNLVLLNEFLQAYAKIDVNEGKFGLYTEMAAKEGNFVGYVKPIITDLKVLGKEDRNDNILRKVWEGIVAGLAVILKNQQEDQLATKIPFEGKIEDPQANIWTTIYKLLFNAFVSALLPAIDHEISIDMVNIEPAEKKNIIERIFGSKKEDKEKGKN